MVTKYTKWSQNIPNGHKNTKWPQKYQMATKYTKNGINVPNGHKIYQMVTKYTFGRKTDKMVIKYANIVHCKTLQKLPKVGFLV
jgi:hypothetical protein